MPCVLLATNGKAPAWDGLHDQWLREYEITVYPRRIADVESKGGMLTCLHFEDECRVKVEALFTTRGDIFHNTLARSLGARLDADGQIVVDQCLCTSVRGLYAAGCVTPANCQMIIAAGQGATAAQQINRDLFDESLHNHKLRRFRQQQMQNEQTKPVET